MTFARTVKRGFTVALTLAAANPANSQSIWTDPVPPKTGPGTTHYDGPPPERFVKETMALVLFTDLEGVKRWCGEAPPPLTRFGCHLVNKNGVHLLVVPHPHLYPPTATARILDHELGHLNGWEAEHPL